MRTALPFLVLLASCGIFAPSEPPRVSTAEERATAIGYLSTATKLLEAARIAGWVNLKEYGDGTASIAKLREMVDRSETVPVTWQVLLDDAIDLSLRWVPAKT